MTAKAQIRRELRRRRAAILPKQRQAAAWAVTHHQQVLQKLRRGQKIAFYVAVGSEFPTWPLIFLALRRGCDVFLPVTPKRGRRLSFVRLDSRSHWQRGQFNIPVPCHVEHCHPRDLDCVFLPLVGFDQHGSRLGQGGGYYDYTFAFRRLRKNYLRPQLLGLAFSCQEVEQLPCEPWDSTLDAVITESAWLRKWQNE